MLLARALLVVEFWDAELQLLETESFLFLEVARFLAEPWMLVLVALAELS